MSDAKTHPADERHETRDVDRPLLVWFALGFAAFVLVTVGVLWLVFGKADDFAAAQPITSPPANGELAQRRQLLAYLDSQQAELDRLGWTDDTHRFAKVPIADAMALLASKGDER